MLAVRRTDVLHLIDQPADGRPSAGGLARPSPSPAADVEDALATVRTALTRSRAQALALDIAR
jgi:hypothetical protein